MLKGDGGAGVNAADVSGEVGLDLGPVYEKDGTLVDESHSCRNDELDVALDSGAVVEDGLFVA